MARRLRDALPGGEDELRAAVWGFMRPILSPALIALNRDGFVVEENGATTVDLGSNRATSGLEDRGCGVSLIFVRGRSSTRDRIAGARCAVENARASPVRC
jgi:hypothetical protein